MDDSLQQDVAPEAPVEALQGLEDSGQESVPPVQERVPVEDPQERNWKAARLKLEEQARAMQAMQQELLALRERSHKAPEPEENEEDFTDTEKRLYREIKTLKNEVSKAKTRESDTVVDRLRSKYPDFDTVMDPENINFLKTNNPALAKALVSLKDDPYEQGLAAYDALRTTSWYQGQKHMEEKTKIEQNVKKPLSVQAVRKQGALSEANRFANGLTPELKKALIKEMAEARKGS